MTSDEVIKMMEKAKDLGVTYLEFNGMKIKLKYKNSSDMEAYIKAPPLKFKENPFYRGPEVPESKPEELVKPLSPLDEMSPEEVLFYATPYYDELQAQKEAHAKKLAEEGLG
jgi:hypothetical protein